MMDEGKLRSDFFFRIFVADLHIPPLRERRGDIAPLAQALFKKFDILGRETELPQRVLDTLTQYDWPGNIRELNNVIMRYLSTGELLFLRPKNKTSAPAHADGFDMERALRETKSHYIAKALQQTHGNKKAAAELLGLNLRTFQRYCKELGLVRKLPALDSFIHADRQNEGEIYK